MAGAAGQQKTHDRCQPWVLVEIQLNNERQRRHLLRRRPGRLVDYFPTSREMVPVETGPGQALFSGNCAHFWHQSQFSGVPIKIKNRPFETPPLAPDRLVFDLDRSHASG